MENKTIAIMYDFDKRYSLFDNNNSNRLKTYIESNKRIPQEIISYTKLAKEASKKWKAN